jgi:hypothetical protein
VVLTGETLTELRAAFAEQTARIPDGRAAALAARVQARRRTAAHRAVAAGAAVVTAVLVVGGGVVVVAERDVDARPAIARSLTTAGAAAHLRLAGYEFALPETFAAVNDNCLHALAGPFIPIQSTGVFAASPAGGCIGAALVPSSGVPSNATAVVVGSRNGLVSTDNGTVRLFVPVPAPDQRYLVLVGTGVTESQLIKMAVDGLPF